MKFLKSIFPMLRGSELGICFVYFLALYYSETLISFDSGLGKSLGIIVLMEFFLCHSSVFFAVFVFNDKVDVFGKSLRYKIGIGLSLFYFVFVLAFSNAENSYYPLITYALLTLSRFQKLIFTKSFDPIKEALSGFGRIAAYLLTAALTLTELVGFGNYNSNLMVDNLGGDVTPLQWLNWGFLYFLVIGIFSLVPLKIGHFKSKKKRYLP